MNWVIRDYIVILQVSKNLLHIHVRKLTKLIIDCNQRFCFQAVFYASYNLAWKISTLASTSTLMKNIQILDYSSTIYDTKNEIF